jgi:hypothetical protein
MLKNTVVVRQVALMGALRGEQMFLSEEVRSLGARRRFWLGTVAT